VDPADQETEDWIEIFNPSSSPVSLDGWHLSDDPAQPLKFAIPDGFIIPANGFILIWADGEPRQNTPAVRQDIHTNFRLSAGGEDIILTAPDASEIDAVTFPEQASGIARLRAIDGSDLFTYSIAPTPRLSNGSPPTREAVEVTITKNVINFSSNPGEVYEMQTSRNLAHWESSDAPVVGNGGTVEFPIPADRGPLFFRIITH
jgi:hypothetical protein